MDVLDKCQRDALETEDEDVYFEKSQVHRYMQTTQFPVSYEVFGGRKSRVDLPTPPTPKKYSGLVSHLLHTRNLKTLNDQVSKILTCGLVVEEHLYVLANLYEGHQRAQSLREEKICPMKLLIFSSGVFSVAWSSTMYFLNKGGTLTHLLPVMVPITSWACWKAKERKDDLRCSECTSRFIHAIEALFVAVRKSVKLLQENETFVESFFNSRSANVTHRKPSYDTNLHLMPSFRETVVANVENAVTVLFQTAESMDDNVPLLYVPIEEYGLKLEFQDILAEKRFLLATIKRLLSSFVFVQSEVLLRLALSLCPTFWMAPVSTNLENIFSAISLATDKLRVFETNISKEYQIFCSFEVSPPETTPAQTVAKPFSLKLVDVYTGVVTAMMRLQAMLLATRAVKESIESYEFAGDDIQDQKFMGVVEDDLSNIYDEVNGLFANFHSTLAELKKLTRRKLEIDPLIIPKNVDEPSSDAVVKQEEYVVEDEVFELYCRKNDGIDNEREHDFSTEDIAEKEKLKQSGTLVKELKYVLKGKAEEWRVREEIALRKRPDFEMTDSNSDDRSLASVMEELLQRDLGLKMSVNEEKKDVSNLPRADVAMEVGRALNENALRVIFPVLEADEEFCCSGDEADEEFCCSGDESDEEDKTAEAR